MQYRATIEKEGRAFNVSFPDCPGCLTFGKSEADALTQAHEALEGWLEASLVSGVVPPAPKAKRGHAITVNPHLSAVVLIRQRRAALGLSQAEVAKRAGVSQQQIARLENPDGNPTVAMLVKVAEALGCRVELNLTAA
ncbi:MAG TPA: type II toxin-antitoxin system HicB family antitoxin [Polyangiaceae bacterium]|jgi:predicted RNase H-like HicB family nuclease